MAEALKMIERTVAAEWGKARLTLLKVHFRGVGRFRARNERNCEIGGITQGRFTRRCDLVVRLAWTPSRGFVPRSVCDRVSKPSRRTASCLSEAGKKPSYH